MKARLLSAGSGLDRILRHLRRGAAAYGVLLISLLLTGLAWYYVRENVEEQNGVRFDEATQATQAAIDRRVNAYLDAMFGARGLFLASGSVERDEWTSYVRGIEPENRLQGLQSLGFAERVRPGERESSAREAFPLRFVAPSNEANRSTVNDDAYSDPAHQAAMDRARDTGSPQATGMVYVFTETAPNSSAHLALRPGFFVYLPVYQEGEPESTVAERRRALEGFVVGAFRRDGLFDDVFGGAFDPAIDFEVYDGGKVASSSLLYDSDGVRRAGEEGYDPLFTEEEQTRVAGRDWTLYFATLPEFEEGVAESNLPAFVLASGIAVSLLLFGITWMLVRSRILAERASKDLQDANRELEGANKELEAFSYSVSHDLRAPLRTIDGFSQILLEDYADELDEEGEDYLGRVRAASQHMGNLIDDLLDLSRVGRRPLRQELVDLSSVAAGIVEELRKSQPEREVEFVTEEGITAWGDANLLRVALENLLGNAWKFTSKKPEAKIEFGMVRNDRGTPSSSSSSSYYYVADNGAGFDARYSEKLFGAFQRLHGAQEFEGTGIGLATVARIVHRHGGRVWAEGEVGKGATFFFTLGNGHHRAPTSPTKTEKIA